MLIAVLLIGFLLLGLVFKLAKGIIKLLLIIILIALIATGSVITRDEPASVPATTNL